MRNQYSFSKHVIIYAIILFLCLIVLVISSKESKKREELYNSFAEPAEATVTKYSIEAKRLRRYSIYYHNITFEFMINNKKYVISNYYKGPKDPISSVGSKMNIHYNKNNPKSAMPDEILTYNKNNNKTVIWVYLFLILLTIMCAIYDYKRYKTYS